MKLVSVLVPVYNVVDTLEKCVDSILSQTYKNIEIVLVNDGSTDGSGELCDKLHEEHPAIRVVHKINEGLGPTRNRGVQESTGEYIYHCDSDDWLEPNLVESCIEMLESNNAEMVIFGYNLLTQDSKGFHLYDKSYANDCVLNSKEEVRNFFVHNYYNYFLVNSLCNKFWRRSFIVDNQLFVPPLRRSQDMAYALLTFDKLNKVVVTSECFYNYLIQPGVFNKGRSYAETLDTLFKIYENTERTFMNWGLYTEIEERKLVNKTCELIANLTTHAMSCKYRKEWRSIADVLLKRDDIIFMLERYSGTTSIFMRLFNIAISRKSPLLVKLVAELHHLREKLLFVAKYIR